MAYVQATSVGGTHPALVEAMGAGDLVLAFATPENREVLAGTGLLFADEAELGAALTRVVGHPDAPELAALRAAARARAAAAFPGPPSPTCTKPSSSASSRAGRPRYARGRGGVPPRPPAPIARGRRAHVVDAGRDGEHVQHVVQVRGPGGRAGSRCRPWAGSGQSSQAWRRRARACGRGWQATTRSASVVMTAALGTQSPVAGSFQAAHTPAIASTAPSGGCRRAASARQSVAIRRSRRWARCSGADRKLVRTPGCSPPSQPAR